MKKSDALPKAATPRPKRAASKARVRPAPGAVSKRRVPTKARVARSTRSPKMSSSLIQAWKRFWGGVLAALGISLGLVGLVQLGSAPTPLVEGEWSDLAQKSRAERLQYWSQALMRETPAELFEIAKSVSIEDDMPIVPTAYDCTTFVETVSALAQSENIAEFVPRLLELRYAQGVDKTDFFHRNHFPEADWVPNNVVRGNFRDITRLVASVAGETFQRETKIIDRGRWFAKQVRRGGVSRSLASVAAAQGGWLEPVQATVEYIALDRVSAIQDAIPDGTIVNIVRKSNDRQPVLISHQGFVFRNENGLIFHHASRGGKIQAVPLTAYLKSFAEAGNRANWPVVGINLLSVR